MWSMFVILAAALLTLLVVCFFVGRQRAVGLAGNDYAATHSLPNYHGWWLALCATGPAFVVLAAWTLISARVERSMVFNAFSEQTSKLSAAQLDGFWRDIQAMVHGGVAGIRDPLRDQAAAYYASIDQISTLLMIAAVLAAVVFGFLHAWRAIAPQFRARHRVESAVLVFLVFSAGVAILTTIGIVLSLIAESIRFFSLVSPIDFLFGLTWTPQQMAFRADQVGGTAAFGFIPLITGTLLITFIAMCVAAPIGILSAIYLSDYATPPVERRCHRALRRAGGIGGRVLHLHRLDLPRRDQLPALHQPRIQREEPYRRRPEGRLRGQQRQVGSRRLRAQHHRCRQRPGRGRFQQQHRLRERTAGDRRDVQRQVLIGRSAPANGARPPR